MLLSLFSTITESLATVIDKFNLKVQKLTGNTFTAVLFIAMAIISVPLLLYFSITNPSVFTPTTFGLLLLVVFGSTLQNMLFYKGLTQRNLSSLEPLRNTEPMFVIIMAFFLFPDERNITVLILGAITSLALVYAHIEKSNEGLWHVQFDRYTLFVIVSMFISGLLHLVYKIILVSVSSVTLYSVRAIGVAIILGLFVRPKLALISSKQRGYFFLSAILYSAAAILKYYSITTIGIGSTVLILTSGPALVYLLSKFLLKEQLTANKIVASVIIVICLIVAVYRI
ncbi:MAG: DMT family transporter [Patescibacteria group bacterium]|jgi:drug/metabolite transporter (DMT)-like permease